MRRGGGIERSIQEYREKSDIDGVDDERENKTRGGQKRRRGWEIRIDCEEEEEEEASSIRKEG